MVLDALLRPDDFFRDRTPGLNLGRAVAIVLVVALVTTAVVGAFGWTMSQRLTATTEIPNEQRPPDWACDDEDGTDTDGVMQDACNQPKQRTVVVGDLLWNAFTDKLPFLFVGVVFGWLLYAVGLHLASALVGGQGSFADTLGVAAWGMIPNAFQAVVGLALLLVAVGNIDLATSDPELLADQIRSLSDRVQGDTALLSLAAACWQGYIWTFGLKHARDLPVGAAAFAGGGTAFVVLLFSLA